MKLLSLLVFPSLLVLHSDALYNPIPFDSVIVSTTQTVSVMQFDPSAVKDKITVIFTAAHQSTILNTMFDPLSRDLYVLLSNTTTGSVYVSQLVSTAKLDSIVYELPIQSNVSHLNRLTSFTSDLDNRRAFLTDSTGRVTMFSLSGAMRVEIGIPSTISQPIRSVIYHRTFDRFFMISDSTVSSCTGLDRNELQCCQVKTKTTQLRSITFDPTTQRLYVYVTDAQTGIHQVTLDSVGCPTENIHNVGSFYSVRLAIYQDRYFSSSNNDDSSNNSVLIIGSVTQNTTRNFRTLAIGTSIVSLHISHPSAASNGHERDICFRGITYYDYRVALVLAAVFGTIMGIFMCVNGLCCIDFFMTKRIISDLRKQVPHDFLGDRWNKLVEEKYAKLALEIHRKRNDPPPKRKSLAPPTNPPPATTNEVRHVSNPLPKISAYLRHKSESYISRRRSDDYRYQRQLSRAPMIAPSQTSNSTIDMAEGHAKDDHSGKCEENMSQDAVSKQPGELL